MKRDHSQTPLPVQCPPMSRALLCGGCVAPSQEFWDALVALCEEYGWLLAVDEVKTGFGRSGEMFAVEKWGIQPDLMCLGKAMGGGVAPIGAVLGCERAMAGYDDMPTGSTWSWMPWACAASVATIAAQFLGYANPGLRAGGMPRRQIVQKCQTGSRVRISPRSLQRMSLSPRELQQ